MPASPWITLGKVRISLIMRPLTCIRYLEKTWFKTALTVLTFTLIRECLRLRLKPVSAVPKRSWCSCRNHPVNFQHDMHYHWSSSQRCSMMSSQITVWSLRIVALSVPCCCLKWVDVWRQLHFIGLLPSSFLSTYLPAHLPPPSISFFPSHSRFPTVGCCSLPTSWRLDVWLPRWLRMLPQDPEVNQEVVASSRGEFLWFSVRHVSWWEFLYRCTPRGGMRCCVNTCSIEAVKTRSCAQSEAQTQTVPSASPST